MDLHGELELKERLALLEKKIDFLLKELGLEEKAKAAPPVLDLSDIKEMLRGGNKIGAIRRYQDQSGSSLTEAKNAVERLEKELNLK